MRYTYETENVCSRVIEFDLNDNIITNINFIGGCQGNLKAISILLDGKNADEVVNKLQGNLCGRRPTSCADQLTKAIIEAKRSIESTI